MGHLCTEHELKVLRCDVSQSDHVTKTSKEINNQGKIWVLITVVYFGQVIRLVCRTFLGLRLVVRILSVNEDAVFPNNRLGKETRCFRFGLLQSFDFFNNSRFSFLLLFWGTRRSKFIISVIVGEGLFWIFTILAALSNAYYCKEGL